MNSLKTHWKQTAFLRLFTFWKIPLINWLRPSVMEMGKDRTVIRMPLNRRTKNHLNSMYFGALAVGSELVVAAKAVQAIHDSKQKVDFVFKDFKAEFLKRAENDVFFICDQGQAVEALVAKTIQTGERETQTFQGYGVVPSKDPNEKVLQFEVTLSVKRRRS
jgi:acyl-coenzyme A thioesterase PaaI-like protein